MPKRNQQHRYGSGTIFQKGKSGIWYYQAFVEGRRIGPYSSRSKDRKDAERELDKLLGKRARGELAVVPKGLTVAVVIDDYLKHVTNTNEPNTVKEYTNHADNQIKPFFGRLKPHQVTTALLEKYRTKRRNEHVINRTRNKEGKIVQKVIATRLVQDSTINRELAFFRAALNYALKANHHLSYRVPLFPMVREKNVRKGFLDEQKFIRQYQRLPYWGVKALAAASFYTGVRRGELTKLEWPQVDFAGGIITIYDTKNHESREVPILDGPMLDSLREAKRERDKHWPECEAVFAYAGNRLTNPKRSWATAAKAGNLGPTLIHDLRRSANRNMRDLGVPQGIRMKIGGWKTPQMDKRYGIVDRTDMDIVKELHRRKRERGAVDEPTGSDE